MLGERRSPWMVWVLLPLSCGAYGWYWWFVTTHELKTYLGRDDIDPFRDLVIGGVTCGLSLYFHLARRNAKLIQAAQRRAGIADPPDRGWRFTFFLMICGLGYVEMQREMNRIWDAADDAGRDLPPA